MPDAARKLAGTAAGVSRISAAALAYLRARPRLLTGLCALLLLSFFVAGLRIARERESNPLNPFGVYSASDFDDYLQAAGDLRANRDPYRAAQLRDIFLLLQSPDALKGDNSRLMAAMLALKGLGSYLYPPLTAFGLLPLTHMEMKAAAVLFQCASVAALAGFLFITLRAAGDEGRARLAVAGALILLYLFLQGNATNGNVGFFLILLCGGGLLLVFGGGLGREFAGGVLLGLATVLKVTPAFFGLVLIAGRRGLAIAGMGCGALLGLVAPALALGWERNLQLLVSWYTMILATFGQIAFVRPWMNNQSLSGAIGKLFVSGSNMDQSAYGLPFGDFRTAEQIAGLAALVRLANFALYALALAAALCLAYRGWRVSRAHGAGGLLASGRALGPAAWQSPAFFQITTLAVLVGLVSAGVSWYHAYCVLFVPVLFRLLGAPLRGRADLYWCVVFGLFGLGGALLPAAAREALAMFSVFTWLCLGVIGQLLWQIFRGGESIDDSAYSAKFDRPGET